MPSVFLSPVWWLRLRRPLRCGLRWTAALLAGLVSILLCLWLILAWGILPRLDHWRPDIEQALGRELGLDVRIARIETRLDLWAPELTVHGMVWRTPDGAPALQLTELHVRLVPGSLLLRALDQWQPTLAELRAEQPEVHLRRRADGGLLVAGLPIDMADSDSTERIPDALLWLQRQQRLQVRQGRLIWHDAELPPLVWPRIDASLEHQRGRHDARIEVQLPAGWQPAAQPLRLHGLWLDGLLGPARRWSTWRGQWQLDLPATEVGRLRPYLSPGQQPWLPLLQGRLALQAELELAPGRIERLRLVPRFEAARLQFAPDRPAWALQHLQTVLTVQQQPRQWLLQAQQLDWLTREGLRWPASDLMLRIDLDEQGRPSGGQAGTDRVELQPLQSLVAHLPLPVAWQRELAALAPRGRLHELRAGWQSGSERPVYRVTGRLAGLGLAPGRVVSAPGRPGVEQLQAEFSLDQDGGQARLQGGRGSAVTLPGVFDEARVPFDQLDARLRWRIGPAQGGRVPVEVELESARFANADAAGSVQGRWRTGSGHGYLPGRLDLRATLQRGDATRVHRYLPLALPESVRHYVRDAVQAGRITSAAALVQGDLRDFPYTRPGSGHFVIDGQVEGVRLAYAPEGADSTASWPALDAVAGTLRFDGSGFVLQARQATLAAVGSGQFLLGPVEGSLGDYHQPLLRLQGLGQGPAGDLFEFLRRSPVGGWLGHALDQAQAEGPAALELGLELPIDDLVRTRVNGRIRLHDARVQLRPDTPGFEALQAQLHFTERSFAIEHAEAQALGGPVRLEGGLQPEGGLQFSASGQASATGLARAPALPAGLRTLADQLEGRTAYRMELSFPGGRPEVRVQSNLVGMAAHWPAPLGKAAVSELPLLVQHQPLASGPGEPLRQSWRVQLGSPLDQQLDLYFEQQEQGARTPWRRGSLGLGTDAPDLPETGLEAVLQWPRLDLVQWLTWAQRMHQATPELAAPAAVATTASSATSDWAELPLHLKLRTGLMQLPNTDLHQVELDLRRQIQAGRPHWWVQIDADEVSGRIDLTEPLRGLQTLAAPPSTRPVPRDERGRIEARLSHLLWHKRQTAPFSLDADTEDEFEPPAPTDAAEPEALLRDPQQLPTLDVVIDRLAVQGRELGRLELRAGATDTPGTSIGIGSSAGDWRIERLQLRHPHATFEVQGGWQRLLALRDGRSTLDWRLALHDSGALLSAMGLQDALHAAPGTLQGRLTWPGQPQRLRPVQLDGQARVQLGAGEVLQVDPGAARLIGLVNLQSLPRRLLFDFSDVTRQGFSFDRIGGDIRIARGIAETDDLVVRGVLATVRASGHANLVLGTQDLRVRVQPEVNAGAASLAYVAVNPMVGIGTLLGQWLLLKPLSDASAREFRINGRFDAPLVQEVTSAVPSSSFFSTTSKSTLP